MGGRWTRIVVVVLGLALMASFGLSALGGTATSRPDTAQLLQRYDQASTAYWSTGTTDEAVVAEALRASRASFVDNGIMIEHASVSSTVSRVTSADGRLTVVADVTSSWQLRQQASGQLQDASSTDAHRLVFDERTGQLLSDDFLPQG